MNGFKNIYKLKRLKNKIFKQGIGIAEKQEGSLGW